MKKAYLTLLFILFSVFSFAQSGGLQIRLANPVPIDYCSGKVKLGDRVSIEGADINEGLKISISNYQKGEDQLSFKTTSTITGSWDSDVGSLILAGKATAADYQEAVRNVEYTNLSVDPTNGTRSIAITLKDVDYLPETKHFYKYISDRGISWTSAKAAAEARDYYGLQGYLATITSRIENDFIWTKVKGVGWIGASDSEVEGDWKWMTGPEAGTLFWRGNFSGTRINNEFSYWNTGEPNNRGDEDYAHVNQDPSSIPKSWNDLANNGSGVQYYIPQGYIVEYGGMKNDPDISLSAVLEINVWNIQFDSEIEKTICQNDTVSLNHEFAGNYEWYPKTGLDDPYSSNPKAHPLDTTIYKVVSRNGSCADSAFFTVNVKPKPVVNLGDDQNICEGDTILFDAGAQSYYQWNTGYDGQILKTGESGTYHVLVANEYNCFAEDEVNVKVHSYPTIDLSNTDTLFCDATSGLVKVGVDKGRLNWGPADPGLTFDSPESVQTEASVSAYGSYQSYLTVTDDYGCQTKDSIRFNFHKTPTSNFSIDSTACYGYNLGVHYQGDGTMEAKYNWYFLDSIYAAGIGLTDLIVKLGFDASDKRDLGLMVNEGGCESPIEWKHVKVTPNVQMQVDADEGCEPFPVNFSASTTEPVSDFSWYFGDGDSVKIQNPSHVFQQDGAYDVGLRVVSDEGCENDGLIENMVTVHPVPSVETSLDPDSCYPHTLEVHYTGSANPQDAYHWDLASLDSDEIVNDPGNSQGPFEISLLKKPTASIGLQITTEFGCESELKQFTFKRKPWLQLTSDLIEGCPPLDVNLTTVVKDSVDNLTYMWKFTKDESYQAGASSLSHRFELPDHQFTVSAIGLSSITGCTDTAFLANPVSVYPKPLAGFQAMPDEVSIVDPELTFQNKSLGAQNYSWDFGDSLGYSSEFEPAYKYHKMGWYDVELVAENELFCTDTAYQRVLVAFDRIFPPNAFNPNSSIPENRTFLLAPEGVEKDGYLMQIYNRWGERIFEAKDDFIGWDGKMPNGQLAPAGVYTWVIAYTDFAGRAHHQTGTVTLIF